MRSTSGFIIVSLIITATGITLTRPQAQSQSATASPPVLSVAPGFTVERVAGPPLVNRPIVADFDDEGRLYVADSSGSNDKVEKQLEDRPHRIVRLEDVDGDGRYDKSVVFADKMMFPEGTMWFDGSLYVSAPPSIWKLTDTDGDGVADTREEWWQGKTLTGCANDLHGPYLGPDGWIYWTKGAFAEQTLERPGRTPLVTRASHILRRKPGDPAIDVVMTGGMDNPVDVAFTNSGERILTSTFVEQPQLGKRDGIIHAIYGGLYGKVHGVIDGHTRTGDLMPILSQLGPAVPAGLTRYGSRAFGDDYRDNFFAAMFNMRKVTRHVLQPSGATFTIRDSDFLTSEDRDFHPTDVLEDGDGSLLVVDTGAWYKLCCPTSQLAKPDVLGGIYRVRRQGAPKVQDPRGRSLPWKTMAPARLTALLKDERTAVQNRAIRELASRGNNAISAVNEVLRTSPSSDARRNAVWTLARIDGTEARRATRAGLSDADETVRHAAIHAAGLLRDTGAVTQLRETLKSNVPSIQRAAAEALGRIGDPKAIPDLIALAGSPLDRVLEHSVTYALIEINDPQSTSAGLQASSPRSRRAALIALDQMDRRTLPPDIVLPLLDSSDALLKETGWWIASRHPDWGDALATFFNAKLSRTGLSAAERQELEQKLVQFGDNAAIQALVANTLTRVTSKDERLAALGIMASVARTRVKTLPPTWVAPIESALTSADKDIVALAISVPRSIPLAKDARSPLQSALLHVARDTARPIDTRVDAVAAMQDPSAATQPAVFDLLKSALEPSQSIAVRSTAAALLERSTLDRAQLLSLASALETAGPLELPRLLRAYASGNDEAVGVAMIGALKQSKVKSSVGGEVLRPLLSKYPESVRKEADALLESLTVDTANQIRRLETLLPTLQGGNITRGQVVFNSTKATCYSCHAIGYMGGRIGPDLTRIGQVRSERDLLEAILYPSASFARGYEPVVVRTRSGEVHSGVLRNNDLPDEIVLATERDETRIPRRDIVDMQPGTVSLMPQGLVDQLSREELADLLAFLKATRSGA
ncbi:MAG TPA: PVC-type heme-binding CxxCH protein [Vicinamibacterales bacterium]|nr:PVC-type heme-binding CxxCH protein [Vicinamibacterales bacterium]